jgi:hypothetical protein
MSMEEASENNKELSYSAHVNGMNESCPCVYPPHAIMKPVEGFYL